MPISFLHTAPALALCAALVVAGCSNKVDEPAPSSAPTSPKPANDQPATTKPDPNKLTKAECDKLFNHFLDVAVDDMMKKNSPAGMSEAERAKQSQPIRSALKASADFSKKSAECEKEYTRPEYDCMMKSTTEKEFDECLSRLNRAAPPRGSQ